MNRGFSDRAFRDVRTRRSRSEQVAWMNARVASALRALCGRVEHPTRAARAGTPHVRAPREALG